MLAKTGLLIVSNPMQISTVLSKIKKDVKSILYIQLLSALNDPLGQFYPNLFSSWPKFSKTIRRIYSQAANECGDLDVRVLLSGLKYNNLNKIQTINPIDLVIFDRKYHQQEIDDFIKQSVSNTNKICGHLTIDSGSFEDIPADHTKDKVYSHTVLGGTFDRLHTAHKLLLSEAALRSNAKVTVGVTEENMLASKTLWELVEPLSTRIRTVEDFLKDVCPELSINVVPITDPYGPTQHDASMDLLVVSAETLKGGNQVNEVRASKDLPAIDVLAVELIDEPYPNPNEETKISSSTARMRILGTLLKPPRQGLAPKPYIIGLTGGIATGKSCLAEYLATFGAQVINCDLLAHELYKPGKPCHKLVVTAFGKQVLSSTGEIDRAVLGSIVFKDREELKRLNSIVWPAIAEEVSSMIESSNSAVIIVEAAVLFTAGWQNLCHEVWALILPRMEAKKRLKRRNGCTDEQADARIDSQPSNKYYVDNAHVVFSSLWPVEFTRQQADKAWGLLQARLPS